MAEILGKKIYHDVANFICDFLRSANKFQDLYI